MTWYALRVQNGRESKAVNYLTRRGFQPYWPHFATRGRWRASRSRRILRSAIPGYLFLPADRPYWPTILESPGVYAVLRDSENHPCPLTDGDMDRVRNIDQSANADPALAVRGIPFRKGQRIRLTNNLWTGWETDILEIDKSGRIVIEIPILGSKHAARVSPNDVEAA